MDLSPPHLHLLLNHVPVLGPFFLALLLTIGLLRRSRELQRLALALTVLLPVATYGVQLTGESAEHFLEEQTWYDDDLVHEHEERAEAALVATIVTGVLALVGLFASRKQAPLKPAMSLVVLLAILVSATMIALTALDGGVIRHDELRPVVETLDV